MSSPFARGAERALLLLAALLTLLLPGPLAAQAPRGIVAAPADPLATVPPLAELISEPQSEMAPVVERFSADRRELLDRYDAPDSPAQRRRMRQYYTAWQQRLRELDFDALGEEGKVDYVLLASRLEHEQALLDRADRLRVEVEPLVPFADRLLSLEDARRELVTIEPQAAARTVAAIAAEADSLRAALAAGGKGRERAPALAGYHAAERIETLRRTLRDWFRYYDGYDPMFSWWVRAPYGAADTALSRYAQAIRERVVGWKAGEPEPIVGQPVGAAGLEAELEHEMIPYTPRELIAIAEREYAWSLAEAKKAAREMGYGDDWKAALEAVKNGYVEPGRQTDLVRDLAAQAQAFFDAHDWVTIPSLAREGWSIEMMSPERQRVNPFFLGGPVIIVSYPTDEMSHGDKLMSMRGNAPSLSHATVFHELNPGHHLQGFSSARYNSHRRALSTPFWSEGQSLYWEMFLWDHGFHATPQDRIGALFWRMHRSARIVFSLSFHLGEMTPQEAVDYLVEHVGFERANAEGEVRRSFNGSYSPLYQAAYMLGGLQLRALHQELVDSGRMTDREFHDAVLRGGPMPIAMVRARLLHLPLSREGAEPWKFAGERPGAR
jgi:hypothetical protein